MRKSILLALATVMVLVIWIFIDSCKTEHMTTRQKILKTFYPVLTSITRMTGSKSGTFKPDQPVQAPKSFHALSMTSIDGDTLSFDRLKGKKVLIVNTASDCGYTGQYEELQQLHERYRDRLVIIGFPANDFKQQEKGSNEEIASFCKRNYGVEFMLASKSSVLKGAGQNTVFQWLSDKKSNGWNDRQPVWNFTKYLVDQDGRLTAVFEPSVDPLGDQVTTAIEAP